LLNKEQIAARRVPLEDAQIEQAKHGNWACNYCNQRFQGETRFMKHHCEPKRRAETLVSPLGQGAYAFYRDWMKMRKFGQPGAPAFLESKFYRSFINFTQLVIDANISRPDKYMELMVEGEIQPALWCSSGAYNLYTAWFDSLHDPLEQVSESINHLIDICEKEDVKLENIFEHLGVQRILSLIRQRRLSPWFLFCSASFGKVLKTLDRAHLKSFDAVVNSNYWGGKFQTERAAVEQIKMIVKEIGL
jgi:hypothetical protein